MRKLLRWASVIAMVWISLSAGAQLKPGATVSLQGVQLWQNLEVGAGYAGTVNCIWFAAGNQRHGKICKMFPHFQGTIAVCGGVVQAISMLTMQADSEHLDATFAQEMGWVEGQFGKPSFVGVGEARWDLGDVQISVHEVLVDVRYDSWALFVDEFSPRSRNPTYGCTADDSGKLGKIVSPN